MRSFFILFFGCLILQTSSAQIIFQDVPNLPFLDSTAYLNGISWIDVDNDNDLDVCVTGSGTNFANRSAIFINDGNGNFSNTGLLQSNQKLQSQHAWADFDNDDDLDLFAQASWEQNGVNEIWKNNGGASLTLTQNTGATPNIPQPCQGTPGWADYDNDGWVDLFIPRWNNQSDRLFHNNGNGTFTEITSGALVTDLAWTTGGYWGDFDNDNDLDLFVIKYEIGLNQAAGVNDLFRNNGNGTFTRMAAVGNLVTQPARGRSANWVDVNNDGLLDIFVCNQSFPPIAGQDLLHINNGDGTFTTKTVGNANHTSWSANWGDYDNDGDQDAITLGLFSSDYRFWENDGQGNLTDISAFHPELEVKTSGSTSNTVVWVDYDLDGWLDLHLVQPDAVLYDHLYKNPGTACKSWLEVKCTGIQSNHASIGATLRAKAVVNGNPVWQMRQIVSNSAAVGNNPLWQHFGFDDATNIDSLVVLWPSGKRCVFENVAVNQVLEISEDCGMEVIKKTPPPTESTLTTLNYCQPAPASVTLTPFGMAGGDWYSNCGSCVDNDGNFHPASLTPGEYVVEYKQGNLCELTIDSFLIHIFPQPVVEVDGKDTVDYKENVFLSAQGAQTYTWTPAGSLTCDDCPETIFSADTTTQFTVIGIDANGCPDTATLTVFIRDQFKFIMPNAFTPNGDQSNDIFKPVFKGNIFKDYHLAIYSRWGERVFETYEPGQGWDGRINETPATSDVYVFKFEYEMFNGEKDVQAAQVTLLR